MSLVGAFPVFVVMVMREVVVVVSYRTVKSSTYILFMKCRFYTLEFVSQCFLLVLVVLVVLE